LKELFPGAPLAWNRTNGPHRDGTRLTLTITETSSNTLIASGIQSEIGEPGSVGPAVAQLKKSVQLFKETGQGAS